MPAHRTLVTLTFVSEYHPREVLESLSKEIAERYIKEIILPSYEDKSTEIQTEPVSQPTETVNKADEQNEKSEDQPETESIPTETVSKVEELNENAQIQPIVIEVKREVIDQTEKPKIQLKVIYQFGFTHDITDCNYEHNDSNFFISPNNYTEFDVDYYFVEAQKILNSQNLYVQPKQEDEPKPSSDEPEVQNEDINYKDDLLDDLLSYVDNEN